MAFGNSETVMTTTGGYLSIDEVPRRYPTVKRASATILALIERLSWLTGDVRDVSPVMVKQENRSLNTQKPSRQLSRNPEDDRIFPLDSSTLDDYKTEHDAKIDKAVIHTGPYADELARSYAALALTRGEHIYFRDKAYNPETEEGRKTLAHELKHVQQYKEGKLEGNNTREELEAEAQRAEDNETRVDNPIVSFTLGGHKFRFSKSKEAYYAHRQRERLDEWIYEQEFVRDKEDYLELLLKYKKFQEGGI